ncbi:hypothetical protein GC089_01520 [Cellulomonas sp. JZ18]|uniref:MSCRAMM family protein n=1 Tax=Cellulomonas sp. JZ18 TaxID=2654191 RepID=UPI0012D42973|nr:carboxypeptidase-like regulatory domain-containing protein [Cellulomonas sp. JZ18]QGQ18189.1 hypothetical protein GC089_01520 [Cellulomonas sp. JZ18]
MAAPAAVQEPAAGAAAPAAEPEPAAADATTAQEPAAPSEPAAGGDRAPAAQAAAVGTASLSGRVTDSTGAPLAGVQVHVGDAAPGDPAPETATDGTWRAEGLAAGSYQVRFTLLGETQPYALYWDGTPYGSWTASSPITLADGEERTDVGVTFVDNTVSGTVTGGGARVEGALVELYRSLVDDEPVQTVVTAQDGTWTARWLRPGTYTVRVVPPAGSGLASAWWQRSGNSYGSVSFMAGSPAQARSGVDVALVAGSTVTGRVVDATGTPVVGTQVGLWGRSGPFRFRLVDVATTDQAGTYVFGELEAESYTVGLAVPDPSFVVPEFLGGALDVRDARWTEVAADADVTLDDLVQREGGVVGGRIVGEDWANVGVWVDVVAEDGSVVTSVFAGEDRDDLDFATEALPPGAYRVRASVDGGSYWWAGGNSLATARVLDVRAGAIVDDVELVLDPAHLALPPAPAVDELTDADRGPLGPVAPTRPGGTVTLTGLTADLVVHVWLGSSPVSLGYHEVAADGTVQVTVPTATTPGAHRLVVTYAGGAVIGWADLTVLAEPLPGGSGTAGGTAGGGPVAGAATGTGAAAGAPRSGGLAATGLELAAGAGLAAVGIAAGAVLVALRRRGRTDA